MSLYSHSSLGWLHNAGQFFIWNSAQNGKIIANWRTVAMSWCQQLISGAVWHRWETLSWCCVCLIGLCSFSSRRQACLTTVPWPWLMWFLNTLSAVSCYLRYFGLMLQRIHPRCIFLCGPPRQRSLISRLPWSKRMKIQRHNGISKTVLHVIIDLIGLHN